LPSDLLRALIFAAVLETIVHIVTY
jgi:hypothetical protein